MTAEHIADPTAPDTIVLIHGLWMTPRSWEKWVERYEGKGQLASPHSSSTTPSPTPSLRRTHRRRIFGGFAAGSR